MGGLQDAKGILLGGQGERPPTCRLAECPWTLVPAGPQGLAGSRVEAERQGVRARRLRLSRCEAAWLKGMPGLAPGLVGAMQVAGTGGG